MLPGALDRKGHKETFWGLSCPGLRVWGLLDPEQAVHPSLGLICLICTVLGQGSGGRWSLNCYSFPPHPVLSLSLSCAGSGAPSHPPHLSALGILRSPPPRETSNFLVPH